MGGGGKLSHPLVYHTIHTRKYIKIKTKEHGPKVMRGIRKHYRAHTTVDLPVGGRVDVWHDCN